MKPGHYCTHAIDDLKYLVSTNYYSGIDVPNVLAIVEWLKTSIKFALPEEGLFYEKVRFEENEDSKVLHGKFDEALKESGLDPAYSNITITDYELESWAVPYDTCAFEYVRHGRRESRSFGPNESEKIILLCIERVIDERKTKLIVILMKPEYHLPWLVYPLQIDITDGVPKGYSEMTSKLSVLLRNDFKNNFGHLMYSKGDIISKTMMCNAFIIVLIQTFTFMRCNNVYINDIPAPKRLNIARQKKGKTPLFQYKILEIKETTKTVFRTGERKHKSPRIHLRRGHIRTYKTGISTYVKPCVVGSKEMGMVHKSYSMEVH